MIGAIDGEGAGRRGGGGQGLSSSASSQPQDFVWPGRGPRGGQAGRQSAGANEGSSGGLAIASSAGRGSGDQTDGGGGLAVGSSKSRGSGDQAASSGSGIAAGAINTEDVGTGEAMTRADRPLPASGAGMGGLDTGGSGSGTAGTGLGSGGSGLAPGHSFAAGGNEPGGGAGSADGMPQVPALEPAGDPAGGSASAGQPGLLSGRGSKGGTSAGAQAPTFGLGQNINGYFPRRDDGSAGTDGALPQSGGAATAGDDRSGLIAPTSGAGQGGGSTSGDDSSSGAGSGAQSTAGDPASGGGRNPKATGTGAGGTGPGQGQGPGRGFDWKDAAKDARRRVGPKHRSLIGRSARIRQAQTPAPKRLRLPPVQMLRPAGHSIDRACRQTDNSIRH